MEISGNIRKMKTALANPVRYYLPIGECEVEMNDLLGSEIQLEYSGVIHCIKCGRITSKSFSQGFCYPCFISAPETEECVLRPELCRAHEGIARDMEYARKNCLIEQIVYISLTSDIKVGVTRSTQVPTRWIDQGAVRAIELARTPNRYLAGKIEVYLKSYLKDKTNWRGMLKNDIHYADLMQEKRNALSHLPDELSVYESGNNDIVEINYPVASNPANIGSLNFDNENVIRGKLSGIKGQYLIFENSKVLNIRKFGGYFIKMNY